MGGQPQLEADGLEVISGRTRRRLDHRPAGGLGQLFGGRLSSRCLGLRLLLRLRLALGGRRGRFSGSGGGRLGRALAQCFRSGQSGLVHLVGTGNACDHIGEAAPQRQGRRGLGEHRFRELLPHRSALPIRLKATTGGEGIVSPLAVNANQAGDRRLRAEPDLRCLACVVIEEHLHPVQLTGGVGQLQVAVDSGLNRQRSAAAHGVDLLAQGIEPGADADGLEVGLIGWTQALRDRCKHQLFLLIGPGGGGGAQGECRGFIKLPGSACTPKTCPKKGASAPFPGQPRSLRLTSPRSRSDRSR